MGLKSIISNIFNAKKVKLEKTLDKLSDPSEKLELAESRLTTEKQKLLDKSVEIVKSKTKTESALKLEKKKLAKTEELMNKKIKEGDDETAKLLFINFESLKTSVAILEKADATAEANKNQIKAAVSSVDGRIRKAKAQIKSIRNLRDTQEITNLVGVGGIENVNKFIKEIEDYINDQQWELEAKAEVAKWTEASNKVDSIDVDCELDEVNDRFEAYKKEKKSTKK